MISRMSTTLLCIVTPVAVLAQSVDLRSPDDFINVQGEIVGFNGVMVQVETTVGRVAVPASEVICYGDGCAQVLASNDFGLTSAAFQGVVGETALASVAGGDALSIGFAAPTYERLQRTIAGAYAIVGANGTVAELTSTGDLRLENPTNGATATLSLSPSLQGADIAVDVVTREGTADQVYDTASEWATGTVLSHQLMGLKSFSVVVAPNAGITAISINDLARVYAGEITNWSQIDGADVNILPLQLPPESEVGTAFKKLVMDPAGLEVSGTVLTMSNEAGVSGSIGQFPGSVGVVSSALAPANFVVDVAGPCGIAVAPTPFDIASGDYVLTRPIMATYNTTPATDLTTRVFDFAVGDVAQALVAQEGFTDYRAMMGTSATKNLRISGLLEAELDDVQRVAAGQMVQTLFDANRLSPTMTGGPASGPEGAWNRAMLLGLLAFMQNPENADRELIFVGFGESAEGSAAAITASEQAAAALAELVARLGAGAMAANNLSVTSVGFGNVAPAACIDGQVTASEYTRVEVWTR